MGNLCLNPEETHSVISLLPVFRRVARARKKAWIAAHGNYLGDPEAAKKAAEEVARQAEQE